MNFYQQKYFQPYRKVNRDPLPSTYSRSSNTYHHQQSQNYEDPYAYQQYKRAPVFQRSPSKHVVHARTTAEPIWEHLYNQGTRSRKELVDRYNNNKHKIDVECTFQPMIKQNKRYLAHSNSSFLDRVNLWHEQKIQKKVKEKEEQVYSDLRECTFAPKINRSRRHTEYGDKNNLRNDKSQRLLKERNRNINPYYSPIREPKKKVILSPSPLKPAGSNVQMSAAMKIIKSQLKRLAL